MQNNFKNKIYESYYSVHTKNLSGKTSIEQIENNFPNWKFYFGEYLPSNKNVRILDAGCGIGDFCYWLDTLGYENNMGIDISEELISIGIRLGIKNIIKGDINKILNNTHDEYDIIFCRDVLEHFNKESIINLFGIFKNSLKKNGALIIQVPNGYSPSFGKIYFSDFTHETMFSELVLKQIGATCGYQSVLIKEVTPVPKNLKSIVRYILWKLLKHIYKFQQLIENGNSQGYFSQNIIAIFKT